MRFTKEYLKIWGLKGRTRVKSLYKLLYKVFIRVQLKISEINEKEVQENIGVIGSDCRMVMPIKIIGGKYIKIGNNMYCGSGCRIEAWDRYENTRQTFTPSIIIGDNVKINGNCHIGAINKIVIGNDVLMGNGVFITDHSHGNSSITEVDIPPNDRMIYSKGEVVIEDNVWLCEHVTILPNVKIGYGSIVAANSVVTKDVPEKCIVAGAPAIIVKQLI